MEASLKNLLLDVFEDKFGYFGVISLQCIGYDSGLKTQRTGFLCSAFQRQPVAADHVVLYF